MQKEFTFPLPSNASNGKRMVARPTRVVPLGQALEKNGLKGGPRTGGGAGSVASSASTSRKYSMSLLAAPGLGKLAASQSAHGGSISSRGRGPAGDASDRRPRSASRHRARPGHMAPLPGGSFHTPTRRRSSGREGSAGGAAEDDDNDDDSFGADDNDGVEWWDDNGPAAAAEAPAAEAGSRPSIKGSILKSKLEGRFGGGQAQIQTPPAKLRNGSSHNSSALSSPPPSTSKRLDEVLGRSDRQSRHRGGDDEKSLHSSAISSRRKSRGATDSDAGLGTVSKSPPLSRSRVERDGEPRPRSSTMPSPSRTTLRSRLLRGRPQTRSKSAAPSTRSRSQRRSGAHSPSSPASAPPQPVMLSPSGRVKHGRVARPGSSHFKAASEPFALGEDSSSSHSNSISTSGLPLQVQRRGRYGDKETMFKKVQQIGINEKMLHGMKEAGLIITEGRA